ncbi:MAG: hypothetical protein ACRYHQ_31100 [Janthinobacterium lividum]
MSQSNLTHSTISGAIAAKSTEWAPLPAAITGIMDNQSPAFPPTLNTDKGRVHLGGQAPMFLPALIADAGLVRLGGQSPIF